MLGFNPIFAFSYAHVSGWGFQTVTTALSVMQFCVTRHSKFIYVGMSCRVSLSCVTLIITASRTQLYTLLGMLCYILIR